jgi:hypothetical protein
VVAGASILAGFLGPFNLFLLLQAVLANIILVSWAAFSLLPDFLGFLGLPLGLIWEVIKVLSVVFKQD